MWNLITSRWQKVTGNKWFIATEPNHLNGWIIQKRITIMLLRDAKTALLIILSRRNGAKTGNMVSKT